MSHQNENKKKIIERLNRRLQILKEMQAKKGIDCAPHIIIEIEDLQKEIEKLGKSSETIVDISRDIEKEYLHSVKNWIEQIWNTNKLQFFDTSVRNRDIDLDFSSKRFQIVKKRLGDTQYGQGISEQSDENISEGPLFTQTQLLERIQSSSFNKLFPPKRQFALLGEPGCGKTTVLEKMAYETAKTSLKECTKKIFPVKKILPVLIDLRWYQQSDDHNKPIPFRQFLAEYLESKYGNDIPSRAGFISVNLDYYLAKEPGVILFLFDSMNEMPRNDFGDRVDAIERFLSDYSHKCRAVAACRTRHWHKQSLFQEIEITSLSDVQVHDFITRQLANDLSSAKELIKNLDEDWLSRLRVPQRLKLLIDVCYDFNNKRILPIPRTLAGLLEKFVKKQIEQQFNRLTQSPPFFESEFTDALENLGYKMTDDVGKGTIVDWKWALDSLSAFREAEKMLEFACESSILCKPGSTLKGSNKNLPKEKIEVRFTHQLYQEYFASRKLERLFTQKEVEEISEMLKDFWWEETILLHIDTVKDPNEIVRRILDAQSSPSSITLRLASECIHRRRRDIFDEIIEETREYTKQLIKQGSLGLSVHGIVSLGYLDDAQSAEIINERVKSPYKWAGRTAIETLRRMKDENAQAFVRDYYRNPESYTMIKDSWKYSVKLKDSDKSAVQINIFKSIMKNMLGLLFFLLFILAGCISLKMNASIAAPEQSLVSTVDATDPSTVESIIWNIISYGLLFVLSGIFLIGGGMLFEISRSEGFFDEIPNFGDGPPVEYTLLLNHMKATVPSVVFGTIIGYIAFIKIGILWTPSLVGPFFGLLLLITIYAIYLDWAWSTINWFFNKANGDENPLDVLAFSMTSIVFSIHFLITFLIIIAGIIFLCYHPNSLYLVFSALFDANGIFGHEHRHILLLEIALWGSIMILPGSAGIIGFLSNLKALKELREINFVKNNWYNIVDKKGRLEKDILPMLGVDKRQYLRENALKILSELRLESVYEQDFNQELIKRILVKLSILYCVPPRIYSASYAHTVGETVQRIFVTIRDRYMKRPKTERDPEVVALLSLVLKESLPPFSSLRDAYDAIDKEMYPDLFNLINL